MASHCGSLVESRGLPLPPGHRRGTYHQFPTAGARDSLGENPNIQSALELCSVTILPRTFKCPSQGKMATMSPFPCGARVV